MLQNDELVDCISKKICILQDGTARVYHRKYARGLGKECITDKDMIYHLLMETLKAIEEHEV